MKDGADGELEKGGIKNANNDTVYCEWGAGQEVQEEGQGLWRSRVPRLTYKNDNKNAVADVRKEMLEKTGNQVEGI